ncbi:MAG: phenylalanine--tRNA ligase subunit beta, partial [Dehalococcoidia bacterium]
KGLRPELAPIALRRATQLIQQVAGGQVARGTIDLYPDRERPAPVVKLTLRRLQQVLGMELDLEQVEQVLQSLGFPTERVDAASLQTTVPYWRNDISIEEDLIEEVVRIIGYDSVPTTMLSTPIPYHRPAPMTELRVRVREALAAVGMQETISYPLISLEDLEKVSQLDPDHLPMKLANPMAVGQEYLRPTLRASILATLLYNEGHSSGPFRFFESGRIFLPRTDQLPEEREVVVGVTSGMRSVDSWLVDNGPLGFFDAKGLLTAALDRLGISLSFEPAEDPTFYPGRCAHLVVGESRLGVMGELHPTVQERFDLKFQPVTLFELYLEELLRLPPGAERSFKSLARFPEANRDLALVVEADVPAGRIQELLTRHRLVDRVELFDVYSGENVPAGTKSLAFHVYFQSHERTLTAEEVNRTLQGLLRNLEREVGASLRA